MAEHSKDAALPRDGHYRAEDCFPFLKSANSTKDPAIARYLSLITEGPHQELLVFAKCIHSHDLLKIFTYLRAFRILDQSDCERLSNDRVYATTEMKATELLLLLERKEPHAFWYLAHSLEKSNRVLFQHFHGNIECCVCKDVRAKSEVLEFFIEQTSTKGPQPKRPKPSSKASTIFPESCSPLLYEIIKRRLADGKWKKDLMKQMKKVVKMMRKFNADLKGVRANTEGLRNFGEMLRKMVRGTEGRWPGTAESSLPAYRHNSRDISPLPEVVVSLPTDEAAHKPRLLPVGDFTYVRTGAHGYGLVSRTQLDEELGGVLWAPGGVDLEKTGILATVARPKTCEMVDGRKKYIAVAVFTLYMFYSYIDSWMKLLEMA